MATKKKETPVVEEVRQETKKYRGSQLLKLPKYNNRVAKVVIKPNELYSFEEVDKLIFYYMKKKG